MKPILAEKHVTPKLIATGWDDEPSYLNNQLNDAHAAYNEK